MAFQKLIQKRFGFNCHLFKHFFLQLLTGREIQFLHQIKQKKEFKSVTAFDPNQVELLKESASVQQAYEDKQKNKFGTVGCVALDVNGNIAAGTSTGGK